MNLTEPPSSKSHRQIVLQLLMSSSADRWDSLLTWLKGHGMNVEAGQLLVELRYRPGAGNALFLTRDVPSSTDLFTLPAKAKMNIKTLFPFYPSDSGKQALILSATQLISLHLFLNRPSGEEPSPDPLFGPYISVLPRDFDSHPLTWLIKQELPLSTPMEQNLLRSMPHSAHSALSRIAARFHEDWRIVRKYVDRVKHPPWQDRTRNIASPHATLDFLWAWLNVNTRCLYDDLGRSRGDNLSLCPVFDFANHAWRAPNMDPINRESDGGRWRNPSGPLLCVSTKEANKDEELCIAYGRHANQTLFVEYGFVNDVTEDEISSGTYPGEVDVQDIMEELIESCALGSWIKPTLEDEGYWGDWTLHASPVPAYPSYRLITALRLFCLCSVSRETATPPRDSALQLWRDTFLGLRDEITEQNEAAWRATLLEMCNKIERRASEHLVGMEVPTEGMHGPSWLSWATENVRSLWIEEELVARAVAHSVREGEQF